MVATASLAETIAARLEARADALTDVHPQHWLRIPATREEFFEVVEATEGQPFDLEFEDGILLARMSYATETHELIVANLIRLLGNHYLEDETVGVYGSARLVYVAGCNRAYNPDAVVVKKPEVYFARPGKPLAITNPMLLVEVHSNATEGYDYTHKLDCYQQLEAVQHILFVSQLKPFVALFSRTNQPQLWLNTACRSLDETIRLDDLTLPMREVYRKVVFGESANAASAA